MILPELSGLLKITIAQCTLSGSEQEGRCKAIMPREQVVLLARAELEGSCDTVFILFCFVFFS